MHDYIITIGDVVIIITTSYTIEKVKTHGTENRANRKDRAAGFYPR